MFCQNTLLLITRFYNVQVLAGLLNPTDGKVQVNGSCSFVFQNPDHQVLMFSFIYGSNSFRTVHKYTSFSNFHTLENAELYLPDSNSF